MLPIVLGAAMGLVKGKRDADQKQRDIAYRSAVQAYSPWTKMNPDAVAITDAKGGLAEGFAGGMSGAAFQQGMAHSPATNTLTSASEQPKEMSLDGHSFSMNPLDITKIDASHKSKSPWARV